jgi:hypothetical protein
VKLLTYKGALLDDDSKALSTYGINQDANLVLVPAVLMDGIGGRTPARTPTVGASSRAATKSSVPLDENIAIEPGPRSRSVSPPTTTAYGDKVGANAHAARKRTLAFADEGAARQPHAMDWPSLAESSGHALPRSMEACNVEAFEDFDGHAVDALSHANVEASCVARAAPAVDDAAGNGANALDTSLASDSAGVLRFPRLAVHARVGSHARSYS